MWLVGVYQALRLIGATKSRLDEGATHPSLALWSVAVCNRKSGRRSLGHVTRNNLQLTYCRPTPSALQYQSGCASFSSHRKGADFRIGRSTRRHLDRRLESLPRNSTRQTWLY